MLFLDSSHVKTVQAAYSSLNKYVPIWKRAAKLVRLPYPRYAAAFRLA